MSYDLVFWKQNSACHLAPATVYAALAERDPVDGLETIPTAEIIGKVQQKFPGMFPNGECLWWEGGDRGTFEIDSSDRHLGSVAVSLAATK